MDKNKHRCFWVEDACDLYIKYHDDEWGVPTYDDGKLFEFLILENFQAGLSWLTILKKREYFREAFDGFDAVKMSRYDDAKILQLLENKNIIRNVSKIKAAVNNAKVFLEIQKEFGSFSNYIWSFTNNKIIKNNNVNEKNIPTSSPLSDKVSKDLIKRGMKFVGTVTIYSYLQSIGVVNDHEESCFKH
ncbi:MAG: DNA-3-methyladenine glycosylase I [Rickettsiales bacterium]|nr:DNA-3-methyladenine glycosylase I [Rickettsiales bacterium]